ncbi:helix-turn-helix domain-containing protein [Chryseobacterium aureum]|uniref:helix-turn-helix domain-containing protein n=1 Tax=Chryseobacterium aureum TaxID=2497456 RepID=UPI0013DFCEFB|nr:AraC family transcriptional regulator [Chryseobacterium aureum]
MDLLRALFFSYLYETLIIYDKGNYKNRNGLSKLSVREMDIYMKFKNLISQKIHYHRDLEFYASELCVTPKHLIKLIKNITGQTPKKLIDSSLLSILKYKLEYTALPVSSLAEELNFSSTPAFCRFFKMQTGMTPQQYRNSH